jgi:hypothetical protein
MIRVSVTYDIVTEASVVDGDTADNGYIQPGTEARRSYARGGKRIIDRNIRMSRAGRFDWTLRDALAFLDSQNCASHETCWQRSDDTMSIDASGAYQGCDVERLGGSTVLSIRYTLHIAGATYGTLDRVARLLQGRVYFANAPQLNRRKVA